MLTGLLVALQYLLPQHWLTALVWHITRIRHRATKDFLISQFVALYKVDVEEVRLDVPADFATFKDFFIRELRAGARKIDTDDDSIVSPVDGTVSMTAGIRADSIMQAKGIDYSLDDLLATDLEEARTYIDGSFATFYLAPQNYHRVHAPLAGELLAARYVPGDLFSVNAATVSRVDGLFCRNERLIMHFRTAWGPAAVIFVGALNVGSISTPWSGEIRPRKHGVVDVIDLSRASCTVAKGDLLGWFNMGSTVILLLSRNACEWDQDLLPGDALRMGEAIGKMSDREK
ncbi:MAG: phosphatidylserine decarboxylase [Proteobacteria bacterium]|nr:phosphatidylserine decarboxylase [Pseudomonadota bacterium]